MERPKRKLNAKKIAVWLIIIITIIVLPDASMYWQQFKLKTERLPKGYNVYAELDSIVDDYYEVIRIDGGFIEPVVQANDSAIIIICGRQMQNKNIQTIENIWYRLGENGQITDSLHYTSTYNENHHYETFNDYILDTGRGTYNTWIRNKDTTNIPIQNIDSKRRFSKEEVDIFLAKDFYITSNYTDTATAQDQNVHKLFYFKDDSWHYLITDAHFYNSSTYIQNEKEVKYVLSMHDTTDAAGLLRRSFIHKEHWREHSFWNIGKNLSWGTGNGSDAGGWTGSSYFELTLPRKSIHFKQFVAIDEDGTLRDRFHYFIYKPDSGQYLLLNDIENRTYYIIRPKNKQI